MSAVYRYDRCNRYNRYNRTHVTYSSKVRTTPSAQVATASTKKCGAHCGAYRGARTPVNGAAVGNGDLLPYIP